MVICVGSNATWQSELRNVHISVKFGIKLENQFFFHFLRLATVIRDSIFRSNNITHKITEALA